MKVSQTNSGSEKNGALWAAGLFLAASVGLGLFMGVMTQRMNDAETRNRLDELGTGLSVLLEKKMAVFEYGLRGLAGVVVAQGEGEVTQEQIERYANYRRLEKEFPGARGMGLARKVEPDKADAYFQTLSMRRGKTFKLKELEENKGQRWVVEHFYPTNPQRWAEGLDIASEPIRREAIEQAVSTGQAVITKPITLYQNSSKKGGGFLLALPIYKGENLPQTQQEREKTAYMLSYMPIVLDDLIAKANPHPQEISMSLASVGEGAQEARFYTGDGFDQLSNEHEVQKLITLYGAQWMVRVRPKTEFYKRFQHEHPVMAGMMAGSMMFVAGAFLYMLIYSIGERKRIAQEKSSIAAIVEGSHDAIIGKNLQGTVTSWNRAAARIFGYGAQEAIGKTLAELIVPHRLQHEETEILQKIAKGETLSGYVTRRRRKDGSEVDVSVSVAPILDEQGVVVGAAKTVRLL